MYRELVGTDIDPSLVEDLHEYMGTQGTHYGGKRRTNKRKTRTNKRRTRTNKRRTNKLK
jgi:hypothetical protein